MSKTNSKTSKRRQRTRVGLVFSYNEEWIAGAYYILNIIHALKLLPQHQQPHVVLISDTKENFDRVVQDTGYPFLEYFQYPFAPVKYFIIERLINKISLAVSNTKLIKKKPKKPVIDFLYPRQKGALGNERLKKINWIPDFQEEFLPQYFSEEEIKNRKEFQRKVICAGDAVVLSSKDALGHFETLYPKAQLDKIVLPFAVSIEHFEDVNLNALKEKYDLPDHYFFAPNQFWAHKNHKVILEALFQLKNQNREVVVAFSGNENDYRNRDYVAQLKDYVKEYALEKYCRFLGFIDRKDQLCLMRNAIAMVQPSTFEGWSTVVEDAKALNQFIVLSKIPVHLEQIDQNVRFFDPNNPAELAEILAQFEMQPPKVVAIDYQKDKMKFAENFSAMVEKYTIK
ncbi:MAG: glycosyltransferase [Bacteroidota bacterium]